MPIELLKELDSKFFSTQLNIEVESIFDNIDNINTLNIN